MRTISDWGKAHKEIREAIGSHVLGVVPMQEESVRYGLHLITFRDCDADLPRENRKSYGRLITKDCERKFDRRIWFFGLFISSVDFEMTTKGSQYMMNHDVLSFTLWKVNDIFPSFQNVEVFISPQSVVFPHVAKQEETIMFNCDYDLRKYDAPEQFFMERDMNGDILSKDEKTLLGYFIWLRKHTQELEDKHNAK